VLVLVWLTLMQNHLNMSFYTAIILSLSLTEMENNIENTILLQIEQQRSIIEMCIYRKE